MTKMRFILTLLTIMLLLGCGGSGSVENDQVEQSEYDEAASNARNEELNQNLLAALANQQVPSDGLDYATYKVGPGDILKIEVFRVPELSQEVRIDGAGEIVMPLLGPLQVGNNTVSEIEQTIVQKLSTSYVRNPQVTVFVLEYENQKITVLGALNQPGSFSVRRPMSLLEVLAKALGFSPEAGSKIYVQSNNSHIVVDIDALSAGEVVANLTLYGGDTVFVPVAGTIFVEGAVAKPGAYSMKGDTGILKAITMAGGTTSVSNEDLVQIYRKGNENEGEAITDVNLNEIREGRISDISLSDGDIVVVATSGFKKGVYGFFQSVGRIFTIGYGI